MYYGVPLYVRAPAFYYPAPFYGWAISGWSVPVLYTWGWAGDPWFGYYHSYFTPFGSYSSASSWLTDFLIARNLQSAYEVRAEAEAEAAPPAESIEGSTPISDNVKHMVEQEVARQLEEDRRQAGESRPSGDTLPPSLTDKASHLFIAGDVLDVENTSTGGNCVIGEGDAIQLSGGLPRDGSDAKVLVLASRGSNCRAGNTVSVPIADLVEMHNNMREKIEMGLETLRGAQGKDNLPALPPDVLGQPVPTAYSASLQADSDAGRLIQEESRQADQVEREVLADSGPAGAVEIGAASVVPTASDTREGGLLAGIQVGQSESEVVGILGPPRSTSFLGGLRKKYEYNAGRVIFTDGAVSDVQVSAAPMPAPALAGNPGSSFGPETPGAGAAISQGQSETEVIAILGPPLRVSFLGGLLKVYEYPDRRIVFADGAVSKVQ